MEDLIAHLIFIYRISPEILRNARRAKQSSGARVSEASRAESERNVKQNWEGYARGGNEGCTSKAGADCENVSGSESESESDDESDRDREEARLHILEKLVIRDIRVEKLF